MRAARRPIVPSPAAGNNPLGHANADAENTHLAFGGRSQLGEPLDAATILETRAGPNSVAVAPPFSLRVPGQEMEEASATGFAGRSVFYPAANVATAARIGNVPLGSVVYPRSFRQSADYPPPSVIPPRPASSRQASPRATPSPSPQPATDARENRRQPDA